MKKLIFALIAGATAMGAAQAQNRPYVGVGVASADNKFEVAGTANRSAKATRPAARSSAVPRSTRTSALKRATPTSARLMSASPQNGVPGRGETDGRASYIAAKATHANERADLVLRQAGRCPHQDQAEQRHAWHDPQRQSENGLYAGLGAQYNVNQQVALTLEYERYGKSHDFGPKPDAVTVAARYNF